MNFICKAAPFVGAKNILIAIVEGGEFVDNIGFVMVLVFTVRRKASHDKEALLTRLYL